ncbi:MAG: ATP-binding protein, partial [Bacteroidota bacterium]
MDSKSRLNLILKKGKTIIDYQQAMQMFLKEIILKNFRGYQNEHRVELGQLTALIGRNDAGKSSIFDALAIFFDHPLCKLDTSDVCVRAGNICELRIGCVFTSFPEQITLDSSSTTSLSDEYLLNLNGDLEIHKVYECSSESVKKPKIVAVANHPTTNGCNELLHKKNTDLKRIAQSREVSSNTDNRSNVALRQAIWQSYSDLAFQLTEIRLDKEDAKALWNQISKYFPEYALFRADRPSTDEDAEVQDPFKAAIKLAIREVQTELDTVKAKVKERAIEVAERTLEKLSDFDDTLSSQLNPFFRADPKWDNLFKLALTDDNGISINKRGSGVRRLVLFSFFRAEAERLREENNRGNIIYAVEEPETAQHPNNQRKVIEALGAISEVDGCQVMLTTHVPALASLLPVNSIRYITIDTSNGSNRSVESGSEHVLDQVVSGLGIIPDGRAQVIVCVEGPHDLKFLKRINSILSVDNSSILDIFSDPRIAFVV